MINSGLEWPENCKKESGTFSDRRLWLGQMGPCLPGCPATHLVWGGPSSALLIARPSLSGSGKTMVSAHMSLVLSSMGFILFLCWKHNVPWKNTLEHNVLFIIGVPQEAWFGFWAVSGCIWLNPTPPTPHPPRHPYFCPKSDGIKNTESAHLCFYPGSATSQL